MAWYTDVCQAGLYLPSSFSGANNHQQRKTSANHAILQGKQNFIFTFCYSWLIDYIHKKQLRSSKIRWVDPIIMLQQLTTQIKLPSSDECNQKFFEGCSNWLTLFLTVSKLYLGAILPPAAGERIHDSWRIG